MANTNSLSLTASSSQFAYISDANQTGLDLSGDLTFEMWVKPTTALGTDAQRCFLSKFDSSTGVDVAYAFFEYDSSGTYSLKLTVSANGSTQDNYLVSTTRLSAGTWYHIAVSWDASTSTATFYVNASSIGTATGSATSLYNSSERFIIGALGQNNANGVQWFDGLIDDVRVWNVVRTATEISDNYQKELLGSETGLVGYWKLNNDYLDETANSNDLTAVNSPVFSTDVPFTGATTIKARRGLIMTM